LIAHFTVFTVLCKEVFLKSKLAQSRKGLSPISGVFSMADAKQAELLTKRNWRNYPADMLLNRARARALSTTFPDALLGMGIDTDGDFFDGDRPRHVRNDAPPPPSRAASLIDSIPDVGAAGSAGRATPAPAAPALFENKYRKKN
jgi:hypothetical protein